MVFTLEPYRCAPKASTNPKPAGNYRRCCGQPECPRRNYVDIMMRFSLLVFMALSVMAAQGAETVARVLYVATNGNDAFSGALGIPNESRTDGPFASLAAAQSAVRKMKASGSTQPIRVLVGNG